MSSSVITTAKEKTMKFVKMQGLGNDYIYFDLRSSDFDETQMPVLAVRLSDRHFGIGGDGVVFICDSSSADVKMRMFNADGTEGKMCGNAIRCIARYLYNADPQKSAFAIETAVGIKRLTVQTGNGGVVNVTADMGYPSFLPSDVGLNSDKPLIDSELSLSGTTFRVTCLSMGNPHCVIFSDSLDDKVFEKVIGLKDHKIFRNGINIELIQIVREGLRMRVFERGSGETMACGTGACAAVAAAHRLGYIDASAGKDVIMKGGTLNIVYSGASVTATGEAEEVFRGEIDL